MEYNRVLKQRNTYLKQLAIKKKQPDEYLDVLSEMLSELASKIVFHRPDFMKQLEVLAIPIHDQLSLGREEILGVVSSNDSLGGWFNTFANERNLYRSIQEESNS